MVQLLAFHRGKTLDTFLSQFPVRQFDDDSEYYWDKLCPLIQVIYKVKKLGKFGEFLQIYVM